MKYFAPNEVEKRNIMSFL